MTLVLEGVSKVINGVPHIYPTDFTLRKGTMNVLLGPVMNDKKKTNRAIIFNSPAYADRGQEIIKSPVPEQTKNIANWIAERTIIGMNSSK